MARQIKRLSDRAVQAKKTRGLYPDGNGLYLRVNATGAKSWIFRYKTNGKARDMGLGPLTNVSLARARVKAADARRQRDEGKDPIRERDDQRVQQRLADARSVTFWDCAEQLIASRERGWRNEKHRAQWRSTLATYAYPVLGDVSVADVTTELVLRVLEPIWLTKTETASRLRGRIEAVLSTAKARGLRVGENPAAWRGHLDQILAKRFKVAPTVHHPALAFKYVPTFMGELRALEGIAPRALEFCILTASRSGEAAGARFDEMDLEAGIWTVPAGRMKGHKEHRVPLSPRATAILKEMFAVATNAFVFPGAKRNSPLANLSMLLLLRKIRPGVTVHGFRSAFKTWAIEATDHADHVSEAALAHISADKVRAAYARGTLFEKRRELMAAWAGFCESQALPPQRAERIADPSPEPGTARELHAQPN